MVTSFKEKAYNADYVYRNVPPLALMFGCIAEGCPVQLADGSCRAVEDIRIGDCVALPSDGRLESAYVSNVWKGMGERRPYKTV